MSCGTGGTAGTPGPARIPALAGHGERVVRGGRVQMVVMLKMWHGRVMMMWRTYSHQLFQAERII